MSKLTDSKKTQMLFEKRYADWMDKGCPEKLQSYMGLNDREMSQFVLNLLQFYNNPYIQLKFACVYGVWSDK